MALPECVGTLNQSQFGIFYLAKIDDCELCLANLYAMSDGTVRWKLPEIPEEDSNAKD